MLINPVIILTILLFIQNKLTYCAISNKTFKNL